MPDLRSSDPFVAQLADLCRVHPTRAKWVIVPSRAIGHTLGERLVLEGTPWANLRFETPFDLALETAAPFLVERGIDPVGEEIGPPLIMRLLQDLPADVPAYFRTLASHPEMGSVLWSAVREMRLSGVETAHFPADAFANPDKRAELQALLAAYESWLTTARRADPADVYREARLHPEFCPVTPADVRVASPNIIWAPLVLDFLDALPGTPLRPVVPRVPGLPLARRLEQAPRDEQDASSPLTFLLRPEDARPPDTHAPARPRTSAQRVGAAPAAAAPAGALLPITLFRAGGQDAELEEVFRRILHPQNPADAPLSLDTVEIACASDDYAALAWQKAVRYGWPVTVASGIPITVTRPARALLAWCDWIDRGYPASGLRRLFQSGDIRLNLHEGPGSGQAARLLLKAKATWGRATYATSLAALAASERERADHPEITGDVRGWHIARAERAVRLASWIDGLLAPLPEPGASDVGLQSFVSTAQDFVRRFAATTNELDGKAEATIALSLEQLRALGDIRCRPAYALDLIRAALSGVTIGADRARPGHLHVSSLPRAGFAGRSHTFIVGLEEGRVFPALVEDAVLLDAERARIHPSLATSADRVAESVHAVVSRLAVLPPNVCLSFSCRDVTENRETFPSWPVLQAYRLLRGGDEVSYEDLAAYLGEPKSIVPPAADHALSDTGWWLANLTLAARPEVAPVFRAFSALERGARAEEARDSDEFTSADGFVPRAGTSLDPRTSPAAVSPTGLEHAAECPFRYFLEHGLGLEPIEEEEPGEDEWLDPATRGTMLHDLFADMMRELRRREATADPRKHLAWLLARADQRLAALREEMPPPSFHVFEHERRELARDLEMFLHVEAEAAAKGTRPVAFEVRFGSKAGRANEDAEPIGQPAPIEIPVGGASFRLSGRIDRVDRLADGSYEVVDYKTGSFYRPKYKGVFRGGRQLQHVLYGLAAEALLRQQLDPTARVVSGRYLFPAVRGGGEDKRIARPAAGDVEEVLSALFDTLGAGAFTSTPKEDDCGFCEFGGACGADPIGRAGSKLGNAANKMLGRFRTLRGYV